MMRKNLIDNADELLENPEIDTLIHTYNAEPAQAEPLHEKVLAEDM